MVIPELEKSMTSLKEKFDGLQSEKHSKSKKLWGQIWATFYAQHKLPFKDIRFALKLIQIQCKLDESMFMIFISLYIY